MKVLLVDDDPDILKLVTKALEREGFVVVSVQDALQALDSLSRERFDVVISDYSMPHLSGRDLLRQIRSDPDTRDMTVIIMTAYPEETLADTMLREGAALYLEKPIDFRQLVALIRFSGSA